MQGPCWWALQGKALPCRAQQQGALHAARPWGYRTAGHRSIPGPIQSRSFFAEARVMLHSCAEPSTATAMPLEPTHHQEHALHFASHLWLYVTRADSRCCSTSTCAASLALRVQFALWGRPLSLTRRRRRMRRRLHRTSLQGGQPPGSNWRQGSSASTLPAKLQLMVCLLQHCSSIALPAACCQPRAVSNQPPGALSWTSAVSGHHQPHCVLEAVCALHTTITQLVLTPACCGRC